MKEKLFILILEDNLIDAELIEATLVNEGIACETVCVETREDFLTAIEQGCVDVILADYSLPSFDGLLALELARERCPDVPFIFVTGTLGEEIAVEALKSGATDYIIKDRLLRLPPAVRRALKEKEEMNKRKRAEESLLVKNHAIESSSNAIAISDLQGLLTYVNPSFLKMWGYDTRTEILGKSVPEFWREPNEAAKVMAILPEKESWIGELTAKRKSGVSFDVQVSAAMVRDEKGNPICLVSSFVDISERKQIEARLRQAQKMEAIGTLAGGIAHDFNNILTPIIGYSEIALFNTPKGSRLYHDLEQILRAGARARDLVQHILAFCRRTEQEKKPVLVSLMVKETLKLLRATLPTTMEIRQNISLDAAMSTVFGDPTHLQQILMNLCTNSAHAMRERGGVLDVSLKNVDLDSEFVAGHPDAKPGPHLNISISDTGHGMTETVKQRIFEPYFTTKGQGEGTGLGLATVYGIVKSYHGIISAYSEPGKGTVFHVFLPRIEGLTKEETEVSTPVSPGHGRVLVVDDEEMIVVVEQRMLEHLGYEVVAKSSSIDALETFRREPDKFDLVVTDQTMPQMTGAELAREILKIRPDIPIVLCTGFSDAVDDDKARSIGIRKLLTKPVMMKVMSRTVAELLSA